MYARVIDCKIIPDREAEFNSIFRNEVLPLLQQQPGFVDLLDLHSDTEPGRLVCLSLWNTKADAERYAHDVFPSIDAKMRPVVLLGPGIRTFNVETSTFHRIAAGKAA
ncbi:MAG: antibiotic biosynthesis monooxygenase [Terriglobales bacterium]